MAKRTSPDLRSSGMRYSDKEEQERRAASGEAVTMCTRTTAATALIDRWLEPNPHKPGAAEWRIKGTGLPVWRVLGQLAVELGTDDRQGYREISAGAISPELVKAVASYYEVD